MKVLVFFSGGKDSQACLIHSVKEYGVQNCEAVFCDTGWEHPYTYEHIKTTVDLMNVKLVILKSKKYDGMIDLAKKKQRFPSTMARFCTSELKSIPAIDYVLSHNAHLITIEGIRSQESFNRSQMKPACTYFKWYFEPYGVNKKGKLLFHTYRKKDVIRWNAEYNADKLRPVFDWSGQDVIDYIKSNGQEPNILYLMGFKRVGCFPCIMASHQDLLTIIQKFPDQWQKVKDAEKEVGSTFFGGSKIPKWAQTGITKDGKRYTTAEDIEKYLLDKNQTGDLFDDGEVQSCMSYYGLCE
jgi:3'-phosphoadenosine 5'-phosphosulfate sulfotransferase (PAPS reductase)/FAD synthetase